MARQLARLLALGTAFLVFSPQSARALNSPQYRVWAEIKNSVGVTPGVAVGDLIDKTGGLYVVPVKVKDASQAIAIASIVNLSHQLSTITVQVQVTDGDGNSVTPVVPKSAEQLADLVRQALKGNCFLKEVVVKEGPFSQREIVYPVFTKSVIQFFNDDQAELYKNFNGVAAAVFRDVLVMESGGYSLNPSTAQ